MMVKDLLIEHLLSRKAFAMKESEQHFTSWCSSWDIVCCICIETCKLLFQ